MRAAPVPAGLPGPRPARAVRLDDDALRRLREQRVERPVVLFGPPDGTWLAVWLPSTGRLRIGRSEESAIALPWDDEVSRLHAVLEVVGDEVVVDDPGYSANGTLVDGRRIRRSVRLRDRAEIRVGRSRLLYRGPDHRTATTLVVRGAPVEVTPAQQRVLTALCGPLRTGGPDAPLPTNAEIAAALGVAEETVRSHMKALFRLLPRAVGGPAKRERLARWAVAEGLADEHPS